MIVVIMICIQDINEGVAVIHVRQNIRILSIITCPYWSLCSCMQICDHSLRVDNLTKTKGFIVVSGKFGVYRRKLHQ